MLAVISDLHFTDATTGDLNVRSSAFRIWMDELCASATRQEATELCIVLLGDIFDLIRTEAWLDESEQDRPWGSAQLLHNPNLLTARCREVAATIANNVATRNRAALDVISGRDPQVSSALSSLGIPIRRVYLAGNHDRLYRLEPAVRKIIDHALGIESDGEPRTCVTEPQYGLVARHGHEFDVWNFERRDQQDWKTGHLPEAEDYLRTPIGDPITTELVAKIPRTVRNRLRGQGLDNETVEHVVKHIQRIEHVRPLHACISWVLQAIEELKESDCELQEDQWDTVVETVESSLRQVYDEFLELDYVKEWMSKHERLLTPFDDTDKLEAIGDFLRSGASLNLLQNLMALGEKLGINDGVSSLAKNAQLDPSITDQIHYIAYGHSHVFAQRAMRVENRQEKVYFNSGTWRPRFVQADNHRDFVSWKEMSYLVYYGPDEDLIKGNAHRNKGVSFETWAGTKLKQNNRGS